MKVLQFISIFTRRKLLFMIVFISIISLSFASFFIAKSSDYSNGAYIHGKQFKDFNHYLNYLDSIGLSNGSTDGSIAYNHIFEASLLDKFSNNKDYMTHLKKENPNYKQFSKGQVDDILFNLAFKDAYTDFLLSLNPISSDVLDSMKLDTLNYYVAYVNVSKDEFEIYNKIAKKGHVKELEKFGFTFKNINNLTNEKEMFNMFGKIKGSDGKVNYMASDKFKYIIVTLDENRVNDKLLKFKIIESKFNNTFNSGDVVKDLELLLLSAQNHNRNFVLSSQFQKELFNRLISDKEITVPYLHYPSQYLDNDLRNLLGD